MKFSTLILAIFILVFQSCKKPEESKDWTEVSVKATNYNTGQPLNDIYITIVEKKQKLFESESISISEGFTDENGEYHFGWKARGNSKYSYEYVAQTDITKYYQVAFQSFANINKGSINVYEIELIESAYLNLDLVNVNCQNSNDIMHFRYYSKLDPSNPNYFWIYSYYWDDELSKNGCVNEIGGGYQKLPAGQYTIEWNVTRDSGYMEGSDTFYVADGDSVTYLLEY